MTTNPKKNKQSVTRQIIGLAVTLATTVGFILLIEAYVVEPYVVPSESMANTIAIGDRILASRLSDPKVGDIIVFHPPKGAERNNRPEAAYCTTTRHAGQACPTGQTTRSEMNYVKRIVGVAGDTIAIRDGHVIRNGKAIDEPYANSCSEAICNLPHEITVPPGHVFVMGDNRNHSLDGRYFGPLPTEWIIGKAVGRFWPPGRIGAL